VVGAVSITIDNPWLDLLIINLFGLLIVTFIVFFGNWWDKKRDVKPLPKKAIFVSMLLLAVPANIAAIIGILRT